MLEIAMMKWRANLTGNSTLHLKAHNRYVSKRKQLKHEIRKACTASKKRNTAMWQQFDAETELDTPHIKEMTRSKYMARAEEALALDSKHIGYLRSTLIEFDMRYTKLLKKNAKP